MFSTGQVIEGAVNYTNSNAVCGETVTGENPITAGNQTNLTLPVVQACAAPIGAKWVAAVTNWLCFLIDFGGFVASPTSGLLGLAYSAGSVCQDPSLLFKAICAMVTVACRANSVDSNLLTAPSNGLGWNGQYQIDQRSGNVWGPKTAGAWPIAPIHWGNNGIIVINDAVNTVIIVYNAFIRIFAANTTVTTTLPDPTVQPNLFMKIYNSGSAAQTIATPAGTIFAGAGAAHFTTPGSSISLPAGAVIELACDDSDWIVTYYSGG